MQRVVCVCHVDLLLLQLVASIGVYLLARVLAFWLAVRRRSTCFPVWWMLLFDSSFDDNGSRRQKLLHHPLRVSEARMKLAAAAAAR
ncbi:unnamed protein product [Sphagnum jensenii]|uniref:Secreted protein n=1 Tax=Sphagnum jensenii TaxID=128206 RepID=A0ABP1AU40_9BRYO